MKKSIIIRDDGSVRKMLDDINSNIPFKTSYSVLIRSIITSTWLKFQNDGWDNHVDNVEYIVEERKFNK